MRVKNDDLSRVDLPSSSAEKCGVNVEKASRVDERASVTLEVPVISLPSEKPVNL